jgi:hypothetical protein
VKCFWGLAVKKSAIADFVLFYHFKVTHNKYMGASGYLFFYRNIIFSSLLKLHTLNV